MKSILWLPDVRIFLQGYGYLILNSSSVFRPNLRPKSDADILRDAKLEAMGLPPQDDSPRRTNHDRHQTATDEIVCRFYILLQLTKSLSPSLGYGTLQEANAEMRGDQ